MKCRSCNTSTDKILNFGNQPLANDFQKSITTDKYPLSMEYCHNCGLLQLSDFVDYNRLFSNYYYHTSASRPMVSHFSDLSEHINETFTNDGYLLDIGSNDSTFIKFMSKYRKCIGIDPAINIVNESQPNDNMVIINSFFNKDSAQSIISKYGKPKIITAFNVLAHIPDINSTLNSIYDSLDDNGTFILEVQYAKQIIDNYVFDQIYHEHCYYFTIRSIHYILNQHGFFIQSCDTLPVHGGSLRVVCRKKPTYYIESLDSYSIYDLNSYLNLQKMVEQKISKIHDLVQTTSKYYYGYGAPAKTSLMCNIIPSLKDRLLYCFDTTESKNKMLIPGTNIIILNDRKGIDENNVFMFSWNYIDYINKKENNFNGYNVILPFPETKLIKRINNS